MSCSVLTVEVAVGKKSQYYDKQRVCEGMGQLKAWFEKTPGGRSQDSFSEKVAVEFRQPE